LGEHGVWKKRDFYDSNVRVPFIVSGTDRLPAGKVVRQPVEMVDFLPTLLDLSGFDPPQNIQGRSLLPLIRGEVLQWRPACFSEHDYSEDAYDELRKDGGRRVMVRTRGWKLVFIMDERIPNTDRALYNLRRDPHEQHNLAGDPKYEATLKKLENMARRWNRDT
jgi:arylsulfatase A-like enzyme